MKPRSLPLSPEHLAELQVMYERGDSIDNILAWQKSLGYASYAWDSITHLASKFRWHRLKRGRAEPPPERLLTRYFDLDGTS